MFNYLEWFKYLVSQQHTYYVFFIVIIFIANVIDLTLGIIFAHFNNDRPFSSSKAILGATRKMGIIIVMVLVVPISVIVPDYISTPSISMFYLVILYGEIRSILSHIGILSDDKESNHKLIREIFNKMFGGKSS